MHKKMILSFASVTMLLAAGAESNTEKFVPDISLITDFSYLNRSIDAETYEGVEMPGLTHAASEEEGHDHDHGGPGEGFNFNYAELVIASTVDHRFDLFSTFHLSEESFEVEEAYVKTRGLGRGFDAKIGKFLSSIGRLNASHPHVWSFDTAPLIYEAFLGDHGLLEKGIELTWLAPSETYLLMGVEFLQGENEASFGVEEFVISDANETDTVSIETEAAEKPAMTAAFVKTSFDTGDLTTLLGISYVTGSSRINHESHGFDGTTSIAAMDLTLKYFIDSYASLTWQSEYMQRVMDGDQIAQNPDETIAAVAVKSLKKEQSGYYTQLVYKMDKAWQGGIRYESILDNSVTVDAISQTMPEDMSRTTLSLDYHPSHFSRLRLQLLKDDSRYVEEEKESYYEFSLSFNMAIGAHGAHGF